MMHTSANQSLHQMVDSNTINRGKYSFFVAVDVLKPFPGLPADSGSP